MVKLDFSRFFQNNSKILKLMTFSASKTPLLHTYDPPIDQITLLARPKISWNGYNFRGGQRSDFYSTVSTVLSFKAHKIKALFSLDILSVRTAFLYNKCTISLSIDVKTKYHFNYLNLIRSGNAENPT